MKTNINDYLKWFLDENLDTPRNTYKGNMKLQKLLFFAQLISLAKNNKLLFKDNFSAFENGMVIENIRLKYKNNISELLNYIQNDLSKEDLEILNITKEIYGKETAKTLSDMSHQFEFWDKYLNLSKDKSSFKDKKKSIIPNSELANELESIKDVLSAYEIIKAKNDITTEDLDY